MVGSDGPSIPIYRTEDRRELHFPQSVPKENLKDVVDTKGFTCFEVHYDLVITMEPALMRFSLGFDGKEVGSVQVDSGK
ncbi:hypothetical protein B0T14DRAFT_504694 [Immersiella caudata]|uniref:Uncharacterized protein n=1 Tax=Immersiella caudata TaxID=314043 RepID=A0AA40CCR4_9PEZI|nr:hypothetical protein B0T14DRAFT_504694 [Immersiella caudata]